MVSLSPKPVGLKPRVRGGIQGASRRRRARSEGGPHHPRYAVGHARQRAIVEHQSLQISVRPCSSPEVDMSGSSPAVSASTVTFPRYLARPVFGLILKERIASVAPELADAELPYIREALRFLGLRMLRVLESVKAELTSNVLPEELPIVVNDISSDMPTHMVAVYSPHFPAGAKRRVTLFPIHNIILATHCANLPNLPKSDVVHPSTPGSTISVPVVPLCIPAPEVFPPLSAFLYTKRIDYLLVSLVPCTVPQSIWLDDPNSKSVRDLLHQVSNRLATSHNALGLLTYMMTVNGVWRNAWALGIDDERLWCALDVAWEILVSALAVSTGLQL